MAEPYDGNGDYSTYDDDNDYNKQRKSGLGGHMVGNPHNGENPSGHSGDFVQLNEKANEYIRDCLNEKTRMDKKFPIAEKLLESEIEKVQTTGRIPTRDQKYADIYREKPIRICQKVLVPIREHPKFNFVGKLLGPKGNSLRRLQEETLCKMTVLGRNSMRDRVKEEELRASKDPKYSHLNNDLHVEITTIAPPAEAYARVAHAMAELRKYLIPDSNDVIRQEQLRELMDSTHISDEPGKAFKKSSMNNQGNSLTGIGGGGLVGSGGSSGIQANTNKTTPHHGYRSNQASSQFMKNAIAPKQRVLSILEKARTAMDETRGYENHVTYDQSSYENYGYGHNASHTTHATHGTHIPGIANTSTIAAAARGGPYDANEYETDYSQRRDYYQQHSTNYGVGGSVAPATHQIAGLNQGHNRGHVNR